ncbi:MAG: tripartite tricarboxylate transporter substrate binding protein [Alphaproteobacteria bacterium]|nr:tripartite tricarboxylate transporter substrate binding protein [Alphaproteobacteria bacterium]
MIMVLRRIAVALSAAAFAASAIAAYPDKPVKVVNGFAPGGGSDILLRAILPALSDRLGQPMVVDYKLGAGGNLAIETVAKAAPDGYTVLMGFAGLATAPALFAKLPFDPIKDFAPISLVGIVPNVLAVYPGVPANSVKELVAYAKANPGKLNFSSPGNGTTQHLVAEMFKLAAGIDMVHVPYKGGGQAQADVVSGVAQLNFNVVPTSLGMIRAGKLKAFAVTGRTRSEALPEVPTMIESGYPGFTAVTWNGFLAPAGTPRDIIQKLNEVVVGVMRTMEMKEQLAKIGQEAAWNTPEEFAAFLRNETEKWRKVIPAAGLKPH